MKEHTDLLEIADSGVRHDQRKVRVSAAGAGGAAARRRLRRRLRRGHACCPREITKRLATIVVALGEPFPQLLPPWRGRRRRRRRWICRLGGRGATERRLLRQLRRRRRLGGRPPLGPDRRRHLTFRDGRQRGGGRGHRGGDRRQVQLLLGRPRRPPAAAAAATGRRPAAAGRRVVAEFGRRGGPLGRVAVVAGAAAARLTWRGRHARLGPTARTRVGRSAGCPFFILEDGVHPDNDQNWLFLAFFIVAVDEKIRFFRSFWNLKISPTFLNC